MYNGKNGNMGNCRIDNTGNSIKAMETWKAKMQDMSWEAEEMKAKCRNPGIQEIKMTVKYMTSSIYGRGPSLPLPKVSKLLQTTCNVATMDWN